MSSPPANTTLPPEVEIEELSSKAIVPPAEVAVPVASLSAQSITSPPFVTIDFEAACVILPLAFNKIFPSLADEVSKLWLTVILPPYIFISPEITVLLPIATSPVLSLWPIVSPDTSEE